MALKGKPIAIGTTDTTIYTCPASTEASVHGLVFANNTGSSATITLKVYINSLGTTTTVATGITVAANSTYTWPKPIDVNASDNIQAAASTGSAIVCLYSVYEGSAPAVAVGFTPRGTWSSVATYAINDVVAYNGSSYLAMLAGTNQQPDTATTYWMVLASKGATGSGDLTGPASSTDNAIARFDGTTGKIVQNSAATIADTTGDITAGKYNGLTISSSTGTLTVANSKTLATDNTVTFVGTDSSTVNYGAGGTIAYTSSKLSAFAATSSSELAGVISDETGTGGLVFANSPTLVTPALGTPASGALTNCTSIPVNQATGTLPVANGGTGITALGTGVATALGNAVNATGGNVTVDGTATLTNKTLTNPTINNYVEGVVAIGNTGTAQTLSLTNGTVQTATLTGNCTFTMPTATAGKSFVLILSSGAGSFTGTFTSVKWPSNTAPTITTTASRWDILSFFSDGTNWYGSFVQGFA